MAKNKHLTNEERLQIEHCLKQRISIKQIAAKLGKSTSTISREIRKRSLPSDKSAPCRIANRCIHRYSCSVIQLCEEKVDCTRRCCTCKHCNSKCLNFEEEVCSKLSSPPYICNGCTDEHKCTLRKMYYAHRPAHKGYRETLIESRTGVNISEEELRQLDSFLSPLIKKGQSIHHITVNNPDEFTVCEKTLYRYVSGGLLKARNIDMPRVCRLKMKPRRSKPLEHKVDSKCRIGRTYEDFKSFMAQVDPPAVVEMDTVIGKIGGKVLLTLIFGSCDFMLAILRDHNTSQSIINAFSDLYHLLGVNQFRRLFPVLLTDRGTEFSNPTALEFDSAGIKRSMVFYCDPGASFQKPHIEVGHEFIRRVLPKGSSFDHLCQADIDIMMSHINSYSREKWGDKCPYELFELLYGKGTTDKFNIRRIPPNEIILKPELLKRK